MSRHVILRLHCIGLSRPYSCKSTACLALGVVGLRPAAPVGRRGRMCGVADLVPDAMCLGCLEGPLCAQVAREARRPGNTVKETTIKLR